MPRKDAGDFIGRRIERMEITLKSDSFLPVYRIYMTCNGFKWRVLFDLTHGKMVVHAGIYMPIGFLGGRRLLGNGLSFTSRKWLGKEAP